MPRSSILPQDSNIKGIVMGLSLKPFDSSDRGKLVLFDGDEIKYKCGFSAQENLYTVSKDGEVLIQTRYKKDVKNALLELGLDYKDVDVEKEVIVHPLEHALGNVRTYIDSILVDLQSSRYHIYLSGENNFRHKLATLQPYKGNRDNNHKPHHFQAIHEYLINVCDAEVVDGVEADDALGIRHYEAFVDAEGDSLLVDTILCSQDKDLKMIPGWNYNPNNSKLSWIGLDKAEFNFWCQVLSGDSSDNIPGITGIGEITAQKILQGYETREELYSLVYNEYYEYYNGDDEKAIEHIHEVAKLLWILREPGVTWDGTKI